MDEFYNQKTGQSSGGAEYVQKRQRQAFKDMYGRMPPASEEAEQAVLAAVMRNGPQRDEIFLTLKPEDFHTPRHTLIFQACRELYQAKHPIEVRTLAERLRSRRQLELAGGLDYLYEVDMQEVLATAGAFYARQVAAKSMQRRLISACAKILSETYDTPWDQVDRMLDEAERAIFSIAESAADPDSLADVRETRDEFLERIARLSAVSESVTGVATGFFDLDRLTSGLQPSDLIIIAARPSMGKTAFALNLALNAARAGKKIAFFSLEMSREQLEARLMSITARVNLSRLRQPNLLTDGDLRALYEAAEKMDCDFSIDDTPGIRTLDLRAKCRRMKSRHGLDLVVIDYLQLMRASSKSIASRELEISEISRSLKALAKELRVPVVALAQLNRKLEERDDKRPLMSDLRESGAIEQDADLIAFIYRDDVYRRRDDGPKLVDSPAEIIVGKQRNGPTGTVKLLYKSAYTAFVNLPAEWLEENAGQAQDAAG